MATFTIDNDNNITVFATAAEAAQAGDSTATTFDSQAALAKVSADWPLSRFVDIWNSIAGNKEVTKFAGRNKAVARIWAAIQPIAERAVESQPQAPKPKKAAKRAKPAKKAKATKMAKPAKKAAPAKKGGDKGERTNKKADVIAMMKRSKGVTLAEIAEVTGWQKHTIRGFVSILGSKGGETIESSKSASGERTYRITK
jgi:Protein of unknown function (DUF3489)